MRIKINQTTLVEAQGLEFNWIAKTALEVKVKPSSCRGKEETLLLVTKDKRNYKSYAIWAMNTILDKALMTGHVNLLDYCFEPVETTPTVNEKEGK